MHLQERPTSLASFEFAKLRSWRALRALNYYVLYVPVHASKLYVLRYNDIITLRDYEKTIYFVG